jgi:hypothetical protein
MTTTDNLLETRQMTAEGSVDYITILDEKIKDDFQNGYSVIYMVEAPPSRIGTEISRVRYDLPLPWTYYVLTLTRQPASQWYPKGAISSRMCTVYGRPEKLTSYEDELLYMPFPNLYGTSRTFCNNTANIDDSLGIEAQVNQAVSNFWDTPFSYIRAATEPEIWKNVAAKIGKDRINPGDIASVYQWWSSLSIEEVLTFPWGKKSWGTLEEVKESQYYGYASFS